MSNGYDSLGLENLTSTGTPTNTTGIIKYGYSFDSLSNDKWSNDSSYSITSNTTSPFSVNLWFNAGGSYSNNEYLFFMGDTHLNAHLYFTGSAIKYRIYGSGTNDYDYSWTADSNWHMVSMVYDGNLKKMYFDGVNIANQTTGTLTNPNNHGVSVGNYYTGSYGSGSIEDEVGIWNRSLTGTEITQLYNGGDGITYTKNFGIPTVTLNSPINDANFNTNTINFSANVTGSSSVGISNTTINITYYNGTEAYTNTNISGFSGIYNWSTTLADGNYNWTVYAYGNDSIKYNAT